MRFIATADWHLGKTAHYLPSEARPRYHQARFDAVKRIGQLALEREAEFVIVSGDVFESNQLDRAILSRTFEALREYPVPVVLLPGNHDPLDAVSIYDSPAFTQRSPENVHVLRGSEPFEVIPGVEIIGAPLFSKRPLTDLAAQAMEPLKPVPPGAVRILAGHGGTDLLDPDAANPATIRLEPLTEALKSGLIHFAALGDRHGTYEVAPNVWYPGTPEVTDRKEIEPGNVLLVDADAAGDAVVEIIPVGRWKFLVIEERLNSVEDTQRLAAHLADLPDKETTALWFALSGTLTTAGHAHLEAALEEAGDLFALVDKWQRHTDLAVVSDDEDFADLGLSGFAEAALRDLTAAAAGTNDEAQTAKDALALLYRFAGGSR